MAILDNNALLGKRVSYFHDFGIDGVKPVEHKGLIIGVLNSLKDYEHLTGNDVLFLQDGCSEAEFISADYDFTFL